MRQYATNWHTISFVVIGHHGDLPEDVVAGLDLPQGTLVNRGAPNRNVVD
jgi:hypothetical protein